MGRRNNTGFTLLEVAVVLLIAGLLLGGTLKASELILNARVHNLIKDIEGVQTAFLAFQDRYRARPGDYANASMNIRCPTPPALCLNGNGDGVITVPPAAPLSEDLLVWTHLGGSALIQASYTMAAADTLAAPNNSPRNPWGQFLHLTHNALFGDGTAAARHNLNTGDFIPVEVLAETDRKIDDGQANSGRFQLGWTSLTNPADPNLTGCTSTTAGVMSWNLLTPVGNCAGALILE